MPTPSMQMPMQSGATPMPLPSQQIPMQPPLQPPYQSTPMQTPAQAAPYTPAPSSATGKGHRGLWIGLGAVAAVIALVAAATLLPPMFKTNASQKSMTSVTDTPTPAPTTPPTSNPAPQQANPVSEHAMPTTVKATATLPVQIPAAKTKPVDTAAQPPAQTAPPAAPAGPSQQEVQQAHHRMIDLEARAGAVNDSINVMRKQQQAQGYDMRGDVVTSMNKMNSYLSEAKSALSQNDLQTANEYMDRAGVEVANLEKFLGR
jgi:eukaryotic-like serine/threonine-protein kinase